MYHIIFNADCIADLCTSMSVKKFSTWIDICFTGLFKHALLLHIPHCVNRAFLVMFLPTFAQGDTIIFALLFYIHCIVCTIFYLGTSRFSSDFRLSLMYLMANMNWLGRFGVKELKFKVTA